MHEPPLEVKVWGQMACFTRPESKVERVSYPIMTPSAARGVLEAIYWKPEFAYRVREIVALTPIRYVSLLRNEVTSKAGRATEEISITDDRAQRHTLALCGVGINDLAYIIRADVAVKPGIDAQPAKYRDQFRRRVERGQRFHQPYFGCREFACNFERTDGKEKPVNYNADLGLMLFDIAFGNSPDGPSVPLFFNAKVERGVLQVPDYMYNQLEALRL